MSNIRFSKVVEKVGKPEPYTLWQSPDKDKAFSAALREHRVMTVRQSTVGSKADVGEVGYVKSKTGEILIFPKSLKTFEGSKIIGIKYELLKEADKHVSAKEKNTVVKKTKPKVVQSAKVIRFPQKAEERKKVESEKEIDSADDLKIFKQQVRKALTALEKDQHVTAYKILRELMNE